MLECYTLLAALAQHTKTARLSALVTGNTYRNPTLLAKTITTLDVVSGGRAQLGIGSRLVRARARLARLRVRHVHRPLREARGGAADHRGRCSRGERPTLDGKQYQVDERHQPAAARLEDPDHDRRRRARRRRCGWWPSTPTTSNLICAARRGPPQARRARRPLRAPRPRPLRDRRVDPAVRAASPRPTTRPAPTCVAFFATKGLDLASMAEDDAAAVPGHLHLGRPRRGRRAPRAGARRPASTASPCSCPANGHLPGRVELLGQAAAPMFNPGSIEANRLTAAGQRGMESRREHVDVAPDTPRGRRRRSAPPAHRRCGRSRTRRWLRRRRR